MSVYDEMMSQLKSAVAGLVAVVELVVGLVVMALVVLAGTVI